MEFLRIAFILYIIIVNLVGLGAMGLDKRRARKGEWRISEKTLFLLAVVGGSVGSWLGMYLFHHKTKHWYFVVGMPLILVLQIVLCVFVYMKIAH